MERSEESPDSDDQKRSIFQQMMGAAARRWEQIDEITGETPDSGRPGTPATNRQSPEISRPYFPEISEYSRNMLLTNLGLRATDREVIHPEALQYSHYKPLQYRIDVLTRSIFLGLHSASPHAYAKLKEGYETLAKGNQNVLNDLTRGASLVIEAYQIETGKNLAEGFANIDTEGVSRIESCFTSLPEHPDFFPPLIEQAPKELPREPRSALCEDVRLIGELSADYNPTAMYYGARMVLFPLIKEWGRIYSEEPPPYQPSRYKNDNQSY